MSRIRLDHADLARHGDAARRGRETGSARAPRGTCRRPSWSACVTSWPSSIRPIHDGDAVVIGVRHHLVPVAAEIADVFRVVRVLGDQQRLGLFPGAAAVLLDVPGVRADIVEEPLPLVLVGDQAAERDDPGRSGSAPCRCRRRCGGFRSTATSLQCTVRFLRRAGYGSLDCLFHDGRQAPRRECSGRDDQQCPAGAAPSPHRHGRRRVRARNG